MCFVSEVCRNNGAHTRAWHEQFCFLSCGIRSGPHFPASLFQPHLRPTLPPAYPHIPSISLPWPGGPAMLCLKSAQTGASLSPTPSEGKVEALAGRLQSPEFGQSALGWGPDQCIRKIDFPTPGLGTAVLVQWLAGGVLSSL